MSCFYKAIIQYRGTKFSGWQIQSAGEVTIQGELEKALLTLSKNQEIKTVASGRTDTGVHAFAQVVRIEFPFEIDETGFMKGLNSHLDPDIRILSIEKTTSEFHPIYSAHSKQYRYFFTLDRNVSLFYRDRIVSFGEDLNIDLMNKAAKLFMGERDFQNYYTVGSSVKSTVRRIHRCEILPFTFGDLGDPDKKIEGHYLLIEGDGFLKQMVRMIMGALVQVGKKKIDFKDIEASFTSKLDRPLGAVAPACGLHLNHVSY